jgi:hypothetical protein
MEIVFLGRASVKRQYQSKTIGSVETVFAWRLKPWPLAVKSFIYTLDDK